MLNHCLLRPLKDQKNLFGLQPLLTTAQSNPLTSSGVTYNQIQMY